MKLIKFVATVIALSALASAVSFAAANPGFSVSATHVGNDWTYVVSNAAGSNASLFACTLYWFDTANHDGPGYLPQDQTTADANFYDGFTVVGGSVVIDTTNPKYGYKFTLPASWYVDYSYINHPSVTSTDNYGNPVSPIAPGGSKTFTFHYWGSTAPTLFTALYTQNGLTGTQQTYGNISGVVPEPSSILALMSGVGALAGIKFRRRK